MEECEGKDRRQCVHVEAVRSAFRTAHRRVDRRSAFLPPMYAGKDTEGDGEGSQAEKPGELPRCGGAGVEHREGEEEA